MCACQMISWARCTAKKTQAYDCCQEVSRGMRQLQHGRLQPRSTTSCRTCAVDVEYALPNTHTQLLGMCG